MTYDWESHHETCYKLYIEEGRPLEDIMQHLKKVHKFSASKRAFQGQFQRWNFPCKQKPAHKNDRLVGRIKELWERNLSQREMLRVLNEEEGFDIKNRELMRVRTRFRWLMKVPNRDKTRVVATTEVESLRDTPSATDGEFSPSMQHADAQALRSVQDPVNKESRELEQPPQDVKSNDVKSVKKRHKRHRQSVDPNGNPLRFPSEMTIDEARLILGLDSGAYRNIRQRFRRICQQEAITKKSVAGPARWENVKSALVMEFPQLQQATWQEKDNVDVEPKNRALEAICTDVLKRMRNMETQITLPAVKTILGINPEEYRELRLAFRQVLQDFQFKCKSDTSPQEWEDLKRRWARRSAIVKHIITSGDDLEKGRALELLARDVMKRSRDERAQNKALKLNESRQGATATAPCYGVNSPANEFGDSTPADRADFAEDMTSSNFDAMSEVSQEATQLQYEPPGGSITAPLPMPLHSQSSSLSESPNGLQQSHRMLGSTMSSGMPLDSSLLLATNTQAAFMNQQYVQQGYATSVYQAVQAVSNTIAIYLRLHPSSTYHTNSSLWIGTMSSPYLQELRNVAVGKFPGALCVRVEGILKDGKGGEMSLQIEQDEELSAYLEHVQGATPIFSVQLVCQT